VYFNVEHTYAALSDPFFLSQLSPAFITGRQALPLTLIFVGCLEVGPIVEKG